MAMCILHGLTVDIPATEDDAKLVLNLEKPLPLNIDGIAYYFGRWNNSDPFGKL